MDSIMISQPIINIGCLGSVSDGKSTLVEKLTGIRTQRHSSEKSRNITIKQGYGNMKIWNYETELITTDTSVTEYISPDGDNYRLVNHISFVDCPGHQELIQTMLSSISIMDGAIIVIAVDQPLSRKPQLIQHLAAAKLGKLSKIIICMNKIDLVTRDVLIERKEELDQMLTEYGIIPHAIIPTCFNKKIGINYLLKSIMSLFDPTTYLSRSETIPLFRISRSFDINKPGTNWDEILGGVIGGCLVTGRLQVGMEIEIRPGTISKGRDGKFSCSPIRTRIMSAKTDTCDLESIIPGGLIGMRTDMDPFYCKNDALAGNIVGIPGGLPSVFTEIFLEINLVTTFGFVWSPVIKDNMMLQIGTRTIDAKIKTISKTNIIQFELGKPVCIMDNQHIIICKNIDKILRIVGEGILLYSSNPTRLI